MLDYGCGRGRIAALLGQLDFDVTGADLQPHEYWRRVRNATFVVLPSPGVTPFAEGVFDCCVHFQVLTYVRDPATHLAAIRRALRPGGVLSIQVTNRDCYRYRWAGRFDDPGCLRLYTTGELVGLLEAGGFTLERVQHEGFYAPVFPFAVNFIRRIVLARRVDVFDRDSLSVRLTPPRRRGLIHVIARRT